MIHKLLLLIPIFVFTYIHSHAQDKAKGLTTSDSLLIYTGHLMLSGKNLMQEKVYLHFDNTGYFLGEKIWFKAYVTRAYDCKPTDISRVLYVELVNPGGEVIKKRKLKIDDHGQTHGDITLDSIYGSGFYEVRAYTRYMTNWGNSGIFSRVFPIFRKPDSPGNYNRKIIDSRNYRHRLPDYRETSTQPTEKLNVSFYPEGGKLVKGLKSKVAFLVTDENGKYIRTEGKVTDKDGNTLCHIQTDNEGRGAFDILPDESTFQLHLTEPNGHEQTFPLPQTEKEGCVMSLNGMAGDKVTVDLHGTESIKNRLLGYSLIHYGKLFTCDTLTIREGFQMKFHRDSLPEGVNQLTVFDSQGQILSERLFFIYPHPHETDSIRITTETPSLSPYGLIKLRVQTQPHASFSFSAMDAATMGNGNQGHIKSYLLLSSEVKGYIRHPEYYFESDDSIHRKAADLLMMTQGWRRYDWKLMTYQKDFGKEIQPIEDKLYLFGRIKALGKSLPTNHIPLKAVLYGNNGIQYGETQTDSTGFYGFDLPDLYGEWNMHITAEVEKKKRKYFIGIDRRFSPDKRQLSPYECEALPLPAPNLRFQATYDSTIHVHVPITKKLHALPTVKVKARRHYSEGAKAAWQSEKRGMYWADIYYDCDKETDDILDKGKDIPGFDEWLLERNPFIEGTPGWLASPGDQSDLKYKNRNIVWILNNMFYKTTNGDTTNTDTLNRSTIEPFPYFLNEAKSVYITENEEASRSFYFHPDLRNHVTIFVYTHNTPKRKMEKGTRYTYFQGYNKPSIFEMNNYGELPPMEDFRRTLYWAPNVKTDDNGTATIEFYNNSNCKDIYISAEGLTPDGKCIFA